MIVQQYQTLWQAELVTTAPQAPTHTKVQRERTMRDRQHAIHCYTHVLNERGQKKQQ